MNETFKFILAMIAFAIVIGLIIRAMGHKPKTRKEDSELEPEWPLGEPLCTIHDNTIESVDLLINAIKALSLPNNISYNHNLSIETLKSVRQNIIDVYYIAVWESLRVLPKPKQPFLICPSNKTVYVYLEGKTQHILFPETYHHYRQLPKRDAIAKKELLPKELHIGTVIYLLYGIHQLNTPFNRDELDLQASVWGVESFELNRLSKINPIIMSQEFLTPKEQLTRATLLQKIEDATTQMEKDQAQFDLETYDQGIWERNHAHEIADKKIISKG